MTEKSSSRGEIFVVDDDPAVRETLSIVLSTGGYEVICFADGAALLSVARNRTPACILLDVHIPGKSGLDILKELRGEDYPAPIFIISGQGDIAMAVSAIKHGALDFIEKTFRGNEIVMRLHESIDAYARRQADRSASNVGSALFPGREPLTRREREVLEQFTAGASNKEAGRHLGISPRTIEDHRANIMKKLGARNA
ncbi:MAG: response regulator, partial [Bradyrhizobium sp.]